MRYFFSSGEASGELNATLLAEAVRRVDPQATFEGIGAGRMREAGFRLWRDHSGWASMGPLAAIPRIPKLLATMYRTALHIVRTKPDLVVLVDFGAFNVRLAKTLRRLHYRGPILDVFPPATWLDKPKVARAVARVMTPLTAFEHQKKFYESLGLPIAYFGHPLAGRYTLRAPRPAPSEDGGTVALLPGSRRGELRFHLPALLDAFELLRRSRPQLRGIVSAADARSERAIRDAISERNLGGIEVLRGTVTAVAGADAAWVASGTAVLETALCGVPEIALYIITPVLVKHARRVYRGRYIALPNLVLQREVVPELLQEAATPERLAQTMDDVLRDPSKQYREFQALRAALGPDDALERCAAFAVALAKDART
ncbi:MAG: lipid-A-disaccharide synthase [Vulcanimicrobiaceae bacterium]